MTPTPRHQALGALGAALLAIVAGGPLSCGFLGHGETVDAGAAKAAVAHLEFMKGQVTLEHDGKDAPAQLGYIYVHDALETGADGEARVRLSGGRTLQLGPDSRFVLDEDASGLVLQIPKGRVLAELAEGGGDGLRALSIQTPFGLTQLGTDKSGVQLDVSKDGANVAVLLGRVELLDNTGKRQSAGQGMHFTLGKLERLDGGSDILDLPGMQVVIAEAGGAQVRHAGHGAWTPAKRGQALQSGDGVRVRGGRSLLKVADSSLAASPNAELTFGGAARDGAVETSNVDLQRGGLALDMAAGKRTRVNVGQLQLESATGGQFNLVKTADGYDVAALTGDLTAKRDGNEQPILAGQLAHLGTKGGGVRALGGGEVSLTSRNGIKVFHSGSIGEVTLTWPGEKKDYLVEVGYDSEMKQKVASGLVHQPSISVEAPRAATLHWRVTDPQTKALVEHGSASFASEFNDKAGGTFNDEVREFSDKTTIFWQTTLPAVTFLYKAEPNAAKYRLKVFRAGDFTTPVVDKTSTSERLALEAGAIPEGSYQWSVQPLGAAGEELPGRKFTKLDVVYDNAVPSLTVRSPKNGDPPAGKVRASGVAAVGSKMVINGKLAALDDKGRFDEQAAPVGRPPSVVFRLIRPNAPDVIVIRRLGRGAR